MIQKAYHKGTIIQGADDKLGQTLHSHLKQKNK
jgi:hypothetical protein